MYSQYVLTTLQDSLFILRTQAVSIVTYVHHVTLDAFSANAGNSASFKRPQLAFSAF
jgi:hypothetical protein